MNQCEYRSPETGTRCSCTAYPGSRYCRACDRLVSAERRAFENWMQQVVAALETGYGFHPDDLPDCPYADWHGSGMEPDEAAHQAIALCAGDDLAA